MAVTQASVLELSAQLAARQLSSVEATRACLARIAAVEGRVHAFLKVDEAGALAAAEASDRRRAQNAPASPLDGVPMAVKDMLCTAGLATTAASKMLEGFVPPYDATVVALLRRAGAVILGKLNQDEFAMGSSTENSAFGVTRNPYDLQRTPGGSSGGSAAAVAAGECFASLGTDTGGSIRQPAAFTNLVGLKPTWGRVSRAGVVAFASSLDQVGPLTHTVADAAALLQVLAGHDPLDATSAVRPPEDYSGALGGGVKGLRLGLPKEYFVGGLHPEVEAAVRAAAKDYQSQGATLVEVSLPHTTAALATYYLVASAEASSNLGRYDGVRYGHRSAEAKGLLELYVKSRTEGFGPEVKRRIMLGTFALSSGYYDAYYRKAQQVRRLIHRDFEQAFAQVDALLTPVSPVPPFALGERLTDPMQMYLADVFTIPSSLAGLPGVSVPAGFTKSGLPIGLQLIAPWFAEATLLQVAAAYERAHPWHRQGPEL